MHQKCINKYEWIKNNDNMHRYDELHKKDTKMNQYRMLKMHKEYQCMKYITKSNIKMHQGIRIAQKILTYNCRYEYTNMHENDAMHKSV